MSEPLICSVRSLDLSLRRLFCNHVRIIGKMYAILPYMQQLDAVQVIWLCYIDRNYTPYSTFLLQRMADTL